MKTTPLRTLMLCGALAAPLFAMAGEAATDSDRSHPLAYVKDSIITTKIKAKLTEEKMSSLLHISVDTDDRGAVTLGGTARTQHDADRAVSIARATEGVTGVSSAITIRADD